MGADIERQRDCQHMLLMLIGCVRQFRQSAGTQRARLFRTTHRDGFEVLACGKGDGRSLAHAEVR